MPELPEVETIARALAPRLIGRRILEVRIFARRVAAGRAASIAACLRGRVIKDLKRRGKYLMVELDGAVLTIHLGMTGSLLWNGTPGPHTRAEFILDGDRLLFDDLRQFGRIHAGLRPPTSLERLGPEALDISAAELARRLANRKARIKALLLDQRILAGLGNIYADEALFRAGIHPCAAPGRLAPERIRRLHRAIRQVLGEAIAAGGSSISDYVDADGRPGQFQFAHRVYRRTGEPCRRCGAPIERILVSQRGTHYCPRCQRP